METMQNGDELVFLYQLVDGYTNTSYACHIAALAGISTDIIKRSHQVCLSDVSKNYLITAWSKIKCDSFN